MRKPLRCARSGFGIIDLLAGLPVHLVLLVPGMHALLDVHVLLPLRLFSILKLVAKLPPWQHEPGAGD